MSQKIACRECDLLVLMPAQVNPGETLSCPRCQHTITTGYKNAVDYTIAVAMSALVMLLIANSFPFISIDAQGQEAQLSFFYASVELYSSGYSILAVLVYTCAVILPALYLFMVLTLALPLKWVTPRRLVPRWRKNTAKLLHELEPWAMSEVFLIAILVSLIKIVAMADIVLGIAFWAYVIFVIGFTYIANMVDHYRLWRWVKYEYF